MRTSRSVVVLFVGLTLTGRAAETPSAGGGSAIHRVPEAFIAVDTHRLLGSPDPLPLEAERMFPQLKFERPVELTFAGDGTDRLFVAEQAGVIRVFAADPAAAEAQVFLDLRDVVLREGNEEGLLGLAFHPQFAENRKFYVCYSTKPRSSVVAEFQASADDPARADRVSEVRLLVIPQPFENHNGGSLRFGPDGFLYVGLGDGGLRDDPHDNAQNLGSLLGKILRIDVDRKDGDRNYAVPRDNPFVDRPGARGEVWAYGFRNVWRLGFDRQTGALWAGDVGQDQFEEVNLVERGGNYGWNLREGRHDFLPHSPGRPDALIDPLAEYFRGEGQSVTGGFTYRGKRLGAYAGRYFFGDYLSGNVWTLAVDAERRVEKRHVARTGLQIAAFGEDRHGEMYLCEFDGGIYRLRERAVDAEAQRRDFPRTLSATGLFASIERNEPAAGLIPYELNVPFWSDYAVKDRYLALPKARSVEFNPEEAWSFPVGTVLVKTFWMHRDRAAMKNARRLETRLLVHADEGWVGYTYVYDDDGKEARLIDEGLSKSLEIETSAGKEHQTYYFPSRTDCLTCHTKKHGFVLGLETPQMNRVQHYRGHAENQLAMFDRLGVFTEPIDTKPAELPQFPDWGSGNLARDDGTATKPPHVPSGETATLARVWLDVNCAMCHLPDGIAPMKRDLRFDTPLEKMNVVDQPVGQRRRRSSEAKLVVPGDPLNSDLLERISLRGPRQMPPLATHYVDPPAYEIIRRWITEMNREQK